MFIVNRVLCFVFPLSSYKFVVKSSIFAVTISDLIWTSIVSSTWFVSKGWPIVYSKILISHKWDIGCVVGTLILLFYLHRHKWDIGSVSNIQDRSIDIIKFSEENWRSHERVQSKQIKFPERVSRDVFLVNKSKHIYGSC